jgi:hypothetical protein
VSKLKTKPTEVSPARHIAAIANEEQRNDARTLAALMRRVTKEEPRMWGPSIVGFGSYHYKYASGHEGDSALAAFAVRGTGLVVYTEVGFEGLDALLARLGKHKTGKVCVYIRRLADVDLGVLETLVARSMAETKRRYPQALEKQGESRARTPRRSASAPVSPRKTAAKTKREAGEAKPIKGRKGGKAHVTLLSGGNPQIAKADGDGPVQAYIAAMPGWKRDIGERLDALIVRNVPKVRKGVKWNSPMYGVEGRGLFLGFHVFARYVKVTFFGSPNRCVALLSSASVPEWLEVNA